MHQRFVESVEDPELRVLAAAPDQLLGGRRSSVVSPAALDALVDYLIERRYRTTAQPGELAQVEVERLRPVGVGALFLCPFLALFLDRPNQPLAGYGLTHSVFGEQREQTGSAGVGGPVEQVGERVDAGILGSLCLVAAVE